MLSKKAQDFLTDLKVYLTTYGKNEQQIQEIVEELEDHLLQGEKNGKSVESITGDSPKTYMDHLKKEMKTDGKEVLSFFMLFFPLTLSFVFLSDVVKGNTAYTLLDVIGYPFVFLIGLSLMVLGLRMTGTAVTSTATRVVAYGAAGIVPIMLLVGIKLTDKYMNISPIVTPTSLQNLLIATACVIFLLVYSFISKMWVTMIFPCLSIGPDLLANLLTDTPQNQAFLSLIIMLIFIAIFFLSMAAHYKKMPKN